MGQGSAMAMVCSVLEVTLITAHAASMTKLVVGMATHGALGDERNRRRQQLQRQRGYAGGLMLSGQGLHAARPS